MPSLREAGCALRPPGGSGGVGAGAAGGLQNASSKPRSMSVRGANTPTAYQAHDTMLTAFTGSGVLSASAIWASAAFSNVALELNPVVAQYVSSVA